jgi:hypothetical protein
VSSGEQERVEGRRVEGFRSFGRRLWDPNPHARKNPDAAERLIASSPASNDDQKPPAKIGPSKTSFEQGSHAASKSLRADR